MQALYLSTESYRNFMPILIDDECGFFPLDHIHDRISSAHSKGGRYTKDESNHVKKATERGSAFITERERERESGRV